MLHLPLARILVDKVGPAPGQLLRPRQIAVDGSGNIVVVDGGNHRVQVRCCRGVGRGCSDNLAPIHAMCTITADRFFPPTLSFSTICHNRVSF